MGGNWENWKRKGKSLQKRILPRENILEGIKGQSGLLIGMPPETPIGPPAHLFQNGPEGGRAIAPKQISGTKNTERVSKTHIWRPLTREGGSLKKNLYPDNFWRNFPEKVVPHGGDFLSRAKGERAQTFHAGGGNLFAPQKGVGLFFCSPLSCKILLGRFRGKPPFHTEEHNGGDIFLKTHAC